MEAIPVLASQGGGRSPRIADAKQIDSEIKPIQDLGAELLFLGDVAHPAMLARLVNSPPAFALVKQAGAPGTADGRDGRRTKRL